MGAGGVVRFHISCQCTTFWAARTEGRESRQLAIGPSACQCVCLWESVSSSSCFTALVLVLEPRQRDGREVGCCVWQRKQAIPGTPGRKGAVEFGSRVPGQSFFIPCSSGDSSPQLDRGQAEEGTTRPLSSKPNNYPANQTTPSTCPSHSSTHRFALETRQPSKAGWTATRRAASKLLPSCYGSSGPQQSPLLPVDRPSRRETDNDASVTNATTAPARQPSHLALKPGPFKPARSVLGAEGAWLAKVCPTIAER